MLAVMVSSMRSLPSLVWVLSGAGAFTGRLASGMSSMASILWGLSSRASAFRLLSRFFFCSRSKRIASARGVPTAIHSNRQSESALDVVAQNPDVGGGCHTAGRMNFHGVIANLFQDELVGPGS